VTTIMSGRILRFPPPAENEDMIGTGGGLREVRDAVRLVAPTDAAVLIHGETGTGKELIARAIHEQSPRRHQPYVKINCAAIPAGLLESELFGHERGAFTGALSQTTGRFQLADHGTIFLDEIGDLPLELQPKLLRAVQEQEFERLGSARTISVNVRVVAATNLNLAEMVRQKQFRADLFYRLNVFPISLPPLRERRDDITDLVRHFVRRFAARMNKKVEMIPDDIMDALQRHDWPGNIRELQNVIERAVICSEGPVLRPTPGELAVMTGKREFPAARTGGSGARPYRRSAATDRRCDQRARGRSGASGAEAHHAAIPYAQAWHRAKACLEGGRLTAGLDRPFDRRRCTSTPPLAATTKVVCDFRRNGLVAESPKA
jgi:transcriptional regulator with GAF, ATPase, and Fis domain